MVNPMDLTGKHIVIAGASSGIGAETARLVTKLGGRVTILARREAKLQEVVESLENRRGSYYFCDFSHLDDIEEAIKKVFNEQGRFDGAVYSAGIGPVYPLRLSDPEKVQTMTTVNSMGFIEFVRCITKSNHRAAEMSIVGVSSTCSELGAKGKTIYASTKAAMNGAMRCMAHELAAHRVRVNNVLPGWVKTELYEETIEHVGTRNIERDFETVQYMGLPLEPRDIANAICFLLSDAARYITGTEMVVAGGCLS